MTPQERLGAVRAVHESPLRVVLAVAGGGVLAVSDLLCVPGGSRTVLEALVPYSVRALHELMGSPIEPHVSEEAAAAMAEGCLARARHLAAGSEPGAAAGAGTGTEPGTGPGAAAGAGPGPLAGIACTAALATTPPRRGADRAHVAAAEDSGTRLTRVVNLDGIAPRSGSRADAESPEVAERCGAQRDRERRGGLDDAESPASDETADVGVVAHGADDLTAGGHTSLDWVAQRRIAQDRLVSDALLGLMADVAAQVAGLRHD